MYQILRLLLPLVVATLLLVTVVQADEKDESITMDEAVQAVESIASNCEPMPTRDQMEELITNKKDAQPGTKCFRHCLMEQFELVKKGSTQMEKEKTKEIIEMVMPDDEIGANEIIDKCNQKNAAITEKCEAAHENGMCIFEEMTARGVKMPAIK